MANILLHTETFTKRHACGTVNRNVIKVEKLDADRAKVTIYTDEREIGETFIPVLLCSTSVGGREGMLYILRNARRHCELRGYGRAA